MSEKRHGRGGDFTISAPVTGSAIVSNGTMKNVTIGSPGDADPASLDDLREAIAALREAVEAAGGRDSADGRLRYELQTIEEELDEQEPDGAVIRSRWTKAQQFLGSVAQVSGIAQSTERILALVHALFSAS